MTRVDLWVHLALVFLWQSQAQAVGCAPRLPVLNEQDRTRLQYIQPDSRQGRQIILPFATFPDCGEITSWSMKGRCTGRTSWGFQAEVQLQVWSTIRNTRTYKRRHYLNRTITLSQCGTAVIQFQGLSGLYFSKGSFLGVFLPPSSGPTFELGIKECCTGVQIAYAVFNVSQPLTKIDILQTFQSQLGTPQISVKVTRCGCNVSSGTSSPTKLSKSPPPSPRPPRPRPPSSPPQNRTQPSSPKPLHPGIIAGLCAGVAILVGTIAITVIATVVCRKVRKMSQLNRDLNKNQNAKPDGEDEEVYYSIPITSNPAYSTSSQLTQNMRGTPSCGTISVSNSTWASNGTTSGTQSTQDEDSTMESYYSSMAHPSNRGNPNSGYLNANSTTESNEDDHTYI